MNSLFILLLLFGCGNNNGCGCNDCNNTCGSCNCCDNNKSCDCNRCDNNNSCGCNSCDNNNSCDCDCDKHSERFFEGRNDWPCEEKMDRRQTRSNFPNFNNRSETCGCEE